MSSEETINLTPSTKAIVKYRGNWEELVFGTNIRKIRIRERTLEYEEVQRVYK
jgi:hypothetical protein